MKVKRIALMSAIATCGIVNQASANILQQAKSYVAGFFQGSTQKEKVAHLFLNQELMPDSLYDIYVLFNVSDKDGTYKAAEQKIKESMKSLIAEIKRDYSDTASIAQDMITLRMNHLHEGLKTINLSNATRLKMQAYFKRINTGKRAHKFSLYVLPELFDLIMNDLNRSGEKSPNKYELIYAENFLHSIEMLANSTLHEQVDPQDKEQRLLRTYLVQFMKSFNKGLGDLLQRDMTIPNNIPKEKLIEMIHSTKQTISFQKVLDAMGTRP